MNEIDVPSNVFGALTRSTHVIPTVTASGDRATDTITLTMSLPCRAIGSVVSVVEPEPKPVTEEEMAAIVESATATAMAKDIFERRLGKKGNAP